MSVEVVGYSGHKADERPLRFRLGERWFEAEEILDRWYGPEDDFFKVRADDGDVYILRRNRLGPWFLESYRRSADCPRTS